MSVEHLSPMQCWNAAAGDLNKYDQLMQQYGHIKRRTEVPAPHEFVGRSKLCHCSVCFGRVDAPWHTTKGES